MKKLLLSAICISLSSCSPFGGQSLIESIGSSLEVIFGKKTSSDVVAGSTQVLETNTTLPSENYKVTLSAGGQILQADFETGGGYKVYTSIQGNTSQ
jgi:hypothetical protein